MRKAMALLLACLLTVGLLTGCSQRPLNMDKLLFGEEKEEAFARFGVTEADAAFTMWYDSVENLEPGILFADEYCFQDVTIGGYRLKKLYLYDALCVDETGARCHLGIYKVKMQFDPADFKNGDDFRAQMKTLLAQADQDYRYAKPRNEKMDISYLYDKAAIRSRDWEWLRMHTPLRPSELAGGAFMCYPDGSGAYPIISVEYTFDTIAPQLSVSGIVFAYLKHKDIASQYWLSNKARRELLS